MNIPSCFASSIAALYKEIFNCDAAEAAVPSSMFSAWHRPLYKNPNKHTNEHSAKGPRKHKRMEYRDEIREKHEKASKAKLGISESERRCVMPECMNEDGYVDDKGASRTGAVQVQYCRPIPECSPCFFLLTFWALALIFTYWGYVVALLNMKWPHGHSWFSVQTSPLEKIPEVPTACNEVSKYLNCDSFPMLLTIPLYHSISEVWLG